MNITIAQLGREGLLDDTKPILNEESIYNKLQNNDAEIQKNPKEYYKKLRQVTKTDMEALHSNEFQSLKKQISKQQ